ncbi:MAG: cytochrome c, partial [Pseudorhodobacter sp.]
MRRAAMFFTLVAVVAGAWFLVPSSKRAPELASGANPILPKGAMVAVIVPDAFSDQQKLGARAYDVACAACHGANGQGQDGVAPPLVHKIYEPSHHGDMAFLLAAQNGVRAHHWKFGNMPAVEGLTEADVLNIVAYMRAL